MTTNLMLNGQILASLTNIVQAGAHPAKAELTIGQDSFIIADDKWWLVNRTSVTDKKSGNEVLSMRRMSPMWFRRNDVWKISPWNGQTLTLTVNLWQEGRQSEFCSIWYELKNESDAVIMRFRWKRTSDFFGLANVGEFELLPPAMVANPKDLVLVGLMWFYTIPGIGTGKSAASL